MRLIHKPLLGMAMLTMLGLMGAEVWAQSEVDSNVTGEPVATVYFTGRTVAELPDDASLFEATDPRMSGRFTGEVDEVIVSSGGGAMTPCVFRGTARIENEDGAWQGIGRGFTAGGERVHWNEHYWFTGEGDYEGLSAVMSSSVRDDDIAGLLVEGVVFSGDPPRAEPWSLTPWRLPGHSDGSLASQAS